MGQLLGIACFLAAICIIASADDSGRLSYAIYNQIYSPTSESIGSDDVLERLNIMRLDFTEKLRDLQTDLLKKDSKSRASLVKEIAVLKKRLISVKDYIALSEIRKDKCQRIYLNDLEGLIAYAPSKNLKNYAMSCKRHQYFLCEETLNSVFEEDKRKLQDIKPKLDQLMDKVNAAARNRKHFDIYVDGTLGYLEEVLGPKNFLTMTTKRKFKKVYQEEVRDICQRTRDTLMPVIELFDYKTRDPSIKRSMSYDTFDWINKWKMCNDILEFTDHHNAVSDLAYLHYNKKVPKMSLVAKITKCFGGKKHQEADD